MKTFADLRKTRGMSRSGIAAVLILFAISLSLYYNEYFPNPFVSHLDHIEDLSDKSAEILDLAIRLHPRDYEARELRIIKYQWDITKDYRYPDRVRKLVYLINGMV